MTVSSSSWSRNEVTGLSESTQDRPVQHGPTSDASHLVGLDGLEVTQVAVDERGALVVQVVTADQTASACPSCGVLSSSAKGLVTSQTT